MNFKGQLKLANSNQLNKYLKEIDRNILLKLWPLT